MKNNIKFLAVGLCTLGMSSCGVYEDRSDIVYETAVYSSVPSNTYIYGQGYYRMNNYNDENYPAQEGVSVPETYHVGAYHSPVSFKDRDRTWVSSQNPQGYTIEIADDEKAAQVAQKLYKAPKNDRMAQVKYQRNGKAYYKGLYGTYDSPEAAQKALDALPAEIKQGAGVKNWGAVQGNLNE